MYRDPTRETPDIEEIAPPVVHLDSERSTPDIEVVHSVASPRSEALAQSVPVPVPDRTVDVQPPVAIDDTIEQLAERLAAFCFERLERTVNSVDGIDVDEDVGALAEELRVRDVL